MNYVIQCRDAVSGKTGDFLVESRESRVAKSPIFDSLAEFYVWAKKNNIVLDHLV